MLLGDAATDSLDKEIDGFLLKAGADPSSTQVAEFLKLYSGDDRDAAARALVARGVSQTAISNALNWLETTSKMSLSTVYGVASIISAAVSGFHGYRRNNSIGWGLWWFLMGSIFPVVTPVIGLAQGFGKRKVA